MPNELAAAPYADLAMVSHNQHGFTIDFAALGPADDDGNVAGIVVSRVKVPPSVIFQIASAIAENVDQFERKYGKITPPQPQGT